jgi:hypothetical protein
MRRAISFLSILLLAFTIQPLVAQGDKLDAKQIMGKLNKPEGLYFNIVKELREEDPNWDAVKKDAKEVARLGGMLGKTDPPKGEKDSWQTLTKAYAENTKALETAAGKMDKTAAKAASEKIGKSCETCHMAHKK